MQNLETIKTRSQESLSSLVERGKQQPENVQTWGVTAATGVAGALAVAAVAKGVLTVVGMLANPPVALTVGALGGGALGWSFMQKQGEAGGSGEETEDAAAAFVPDAERKAPPVVDSVSEDSAVAATTESSSTTETAATDSEADRE